MKKIVIVFILIIGLAFIGCKDDEVVTRKLTLTVEELEWIDAHPIITVAPSKDYGPVEFFDGESYRGLSIDYLDEISQITGLTFEYVYFETWPEILTAVKSGEVDMQTSIHKVPDRVNDFIYGDSYLTAPNKVFVRNDFEGVLTDDTLFDYNVGIMEGYSVHQYVDLIFVPEKITTFTEVEDAIYALSFGDIDALVIDVAHLSYYIKVLGISNIELTHDIDINFDYKLGFATAIGNDILLQILNKGLDNISEDRRDEMYNKWIRIDNFYNVSDEQLSFLYFSLIALVLVLALGGFWMQSIRSRDKRLALLNKELQQQIHLQEEAQDRLIESEKHNSLGRLVIGISHEMNTPLGNAVSLISFAERLLRVDGVDVDKVKQSLEKIRSQLERMSLLIEKMKVINKSSNANNFELIDLGEKIAEFVTLIKYSSRNKLMRFELDLEKGLEWYCEPSALYQVLEELVENASIHGYGNKSGLVKITLQDAKDEIILTFRDEGKGMEPEVSDRIFEPFYRSYGNGGGPGLGMYNVYNLVKVALNGELEVVTSPNEGVMYIVHLLK